jgi:hypothetical protein
MLHVVVFGGDHGRIDDLLGTLCATGIVRELVFSEMLCLVGIVRKLVLFWRCSVFFFSFFYFLFLGRGLCESWCEVFTLALSEHDFPFHTSERFGCKRFPEILGDMRKLDFSPYQGDGLLKVRIEKAVG